MNASRRNYKKLTQCIWYFFLIVFNLCPALPASADWMSIKYLYPRDIVWREELFVNGKEVVFGAPSCKWYDTQETCTVQTTPDVLTWGNNYFEFTVKTTVLTQADASTIDIGLSAYKDGALVDVCRQGNVVPNSGFNFNEFEWDDSEFNLVCKVFREIDTPQQKAERIRIAKEALAKAVAELDAATILENFTERIKNMSFDELQRLAIDNDFPGELKGLLEWLKRIGLDIDAKRQAFQESKSKIQAEIDELAEKLEDIAESEGIPKEAIALPEQIETLQPDEEQQKSQLGLLANELVNRLIDDVTTSWQAGDRIKILNLASEFLEQIASLQAQVSSRSLAEPLEAQVVQSAIYRGTQFLYDKGCTGNGCLNRDLWFKDTPVPAATRRVLKEAIRPAFGDAGIQIEKGMRAWAGQLNPNQQYVLSLVDAMGPAALALAGETDALASALYKSLQATAADLAVAVRDTVLTSASFTPGLGDANDLCEVTTAREFCGATGRSLSFSERALSAAGFLIGTGQARRSVGSKLKTFFVGTERTAIVEAGMKVAGSAEKFGFKSASEIKTFGKVLEAIEALPTKLKVQRLRKGTDPNKVAIIGRSMGNAEAGLVGVRDAAAHLKGKGVNPTIYEASREALRDFRDRIDVYRRETGNQNAMLPNEIVKTTDLFRENEAWAQKLKADGYTVLDLGNPNNLSDISAFYEMEKSLLF